MNKVYVSAALATMAIVAGATLAPANVFAWGDSNNGRTTYTLDEINAGKLGNAITMNSITNGKIGDERNFVGAKLSSSNSTVWNADTINVKDGETYTIRLYVHNNSPMGTKAIAQGVKATFSLPTTVAKDHSVIGYLDATNANPTRYWDEVHLVSNDDFYLEFVSGSAVYSNTQGTFKLPDEVITSGATLGFTKMDGQIPGCYEYDGQVTIQVKVHNSVISKLSKTVRMAGTHNQFTESVDAKIGDSVEFQIEYKNLTANQVDNVMIRDILPTNMEYVKGSTILYNSNHQAGLKIDQDTVTTSGINIGSYVPKGNAFVRFTAKVINKTLACGSNQLVNWANVTVNGDVVKDDASVMVVSNEKCTPEVKPTPTPTPTPTPKTDPTPTPTATVIPNTGPAEIGGIALGAGSIVTAGGYYIASRKRR